MTVRMCPACLANLPGHHCMRFYLAYGHLSVHDARGLQVREIFTGARTF